MSDHMQTYTIDWNKGLGGLATAGFALFCGWLDITNNATFAADKSTVITGLAYAAGAGLLLFPTQARGRRDIMVWIMVGVCGAITLFAGYHNHMTAQGDADRRRAAQTNRHAQSQAAITRLTAELTSAAAERDSIAEPMGAAQLQAIYDEAKERRGLEVTPDRGGKCGDRCKAAEKTMAATLPRIADATARERAGARADAIAAELKRERAGAPAQALTAGATAGEETLMAMLWLMLSVGGAAFFDRGIVQIRASRQPVIAPPVKRERTAKAPAAPSVAPAVAPKPAAPAYGLPGFLAQCTKGPEVPQKDVLDALHNWWRATAQTGAPPSQRALGIALKNAGFEKSEDRKRRVLYAIKVPALQPRKVA